MINDSFYPTPGHLIGKMIAKVKGHPQKILEPSAGKGDIIEYWQESNQDRWGRPEFSAIENDEDLQATLEGKGIKLIDTDFLTFSGPDKFDLIIANPPFNQGAEHLLKALDVMYSGQIIFLLNAETLKNPHTNIRKLLKTKLDELGAEVKYIQSAFLDAERKTSVEIALINIVVDRKVETDLFDGVEDLEENEDAPEHEEQYDLMTGNTIKELVAEYNKVITVGTDTILHYFKNFRTVGKYLSLNDIKSRDHASYTSKNLTSQMQEALNKLLSSAREDFWRRTLSLKEVRRRLTKKKNEEFETTLSSRCHMDFTENNIRQFVLNLMQGHEQTLTEAVLEIFDKFTIEHSYREDTYYEKNIHYFNGWKTNNAFKVGKRVIIPIYGYSYGGAFHEYGRWKLDYKAREELRDIDIVMNYFDGMGEYMSIADALELAFDRGDNKAESSYFNIIAYKKGTIHLTFKDMGILRRFNMTACRGKGWLPDDYGSRTYDTLTHIEQELVKEFEGKASYIKDQGQLIFRKGSPLQIEGS